MARTTKKTTKEAEKKVATPVVEAVETPVVETVKAPVAEVVEEAVEAVVEKEAVEAVVEKEAKKAPAKKTTVKKAALTVNVTLQFAGKDHTEESLTAIAKDVWTYDLNKDAAELKTVELYVKPEEGLCYYVFNGDVTGNFVI